MNTTTRHLIDKHRLGDNLTSVFENMMRQVYFNMRANERKKISKIMYSIKNTEDERNGQFGYYTSQGAYYVTRLMKKYKCESIVDLGAGVGIFLEVIKALEPRFRTFGIEIEKSLITLHDKMFGSDIIREGNILQPMKHLKEFDCIYFWEPLRDRDLAEKFVKNLETQVLKGQYIFYRCSGLIGAYLQRSKKFKNINQYSGVTVYKVI